MLEIPQHLVHLVIHLVHDQVDGNKARKPEEVVRSLKRTVAWLIVLCMLLAGALGTCIYFLLRPAENTTESYKDGGNFVSRDDETAARYVSRETF